MNKYYLALCQSVLLSGVCCTAQADQLVSLSTSSAFISAGDTVNITAEYQVSAPETTTEAGLGLRVHFNSSLISAESISLYTNSVQPYGPLTDDTENFDNDPLTDQFFVIGWIDFDAQWPGAVQLPLTLLDIQFTANSGLDTSTAINVSASATAKNTEFQSTTLQLCRKAAVSITTNKTTVNEGDITSLTPQLTFQTDQPIPSGCSDLVINYDVNGSATSGSDFSPIPRTVTIPAGQDNAQLTLNILDDDLVEVDETLTVALQNSSDYTLENNATATITIGSEDVTSNLTEVNLSAGKLSVTEGQGGSLFIYANRDDNNLAQSLEVMIELGGTVTANNDFHAFSGSITIPAGRTQAHAVLVLKDDADQESDETLDISIAASDNYQRGENSSLQLTIQDDEFNQNTNLPVTETDTNNTFSTSQVQQVPATSQWMLILMGLLLSGFASLRLRTKKIGGKS